MNPKRLSGPEWRQYVSGVGDLPEEDQNEYLEWSASVNKAIPDPQPEDLERP